MEIKLKDYKGYPVTIDDNSCQFGTTINNVKKSFTSIAALHNCINDIDSKCLKILMIPVIVLNHEDKKPKYYKGEILSVAYTNKHVLYYEINFNNLIYKVGIEKCNNDDYSLKVFGVEEVLNNITLFFDNGTSSFEKIKKFYDGVYNFKESIRETNIELRELFLKYEV